MKNLFQKIIPTLFNPVVVIWGELSEQPKIQRIFLSSETINATSLADQICPSVGIESCRLIDEIAEGIMRLLNGEDICFSLDILDWNLIQPFQKKVLLAEHAVPRSRVTSYQRLAAHLGNDKASRAVGNALKNNPFPIIIPCHRAIRSDGTLGGFQGGMKMKRALLEMEGIEFSAERKVTTKNYVY